MNASNTFFSFIFLCLSVLGQTPEFNDLLKKAEAGDPEAQSTLGFAYYKGDGVTQSFADAFKWISAAAKQGHADAQLRLGYLYSQGKGVQRHYPTAYAMYALSEASGGVDGAQYLAAISEQMSEAEIEQGKEIFEDLKLRIQPKEPEKPVEPEKPEEPKATDPPAQPEMSQPQKNLEALKEKAASGDREAQFILGRKYFFGSKAEGIPRDIEETLKWYVKSAEQGFAPAQFNLGVVYQLGQGVKKNPEEALKWYIEAAEQGFAAAQFNLGGMYIANDGIPTDHEEAIKWFKAAAEQGEEMAQYYLGVIYKKGEGVRPDFEVALKWFQKAATQGNINAQYELGVLYHQGLGTDQDFREAAKWYLMAATKNYIPAQMALGVMFENGLGVKVDYREAIKWYRMAALQGNPVAQYNLGVLYNIGAGVPSDFVISYAWFNLSAASGFPQGVAARKNLAEKMTPDLIAKSQALSRELASKIEQGQAKAKEPPPTKKPQPNTIEVRGTGTGFFITDDGYFLTNSHVVASGSRIQVVTNTGKTHTAKRVKIDPKNDLAVFKVEGDFKALPLASSRGIRLGEDVFTVGFPQVSIQGFSPKLTKGTISGLAGVRDDPGSFQISVPIQPGNSGGALADSRGNVIGIIVSQLNEIKVLKSTGSLPQNVNYAIKSSFANAFLDSLPLVVDKLKEPQPSDQARDFAEVVQEVQDATVMLLVF
jgi:TPR repeat protein